MDKTLVTLNKIWIFYLNSVNFYQEISSAKLVQQDGYFTEFPGFSRENRENPKMLCAIQKISFATQYFFVLFLIETYFVRLHFLKHAIFKFYD